MRIGELIRPLRAGDKGLAVTRVDCPRSIVLRSDAFADEGAIPKRFSVDGDGAAPGLSWENIPSGTAELVLIVQDPDAPTPRPIVHAVVLGILPTVSALAQGAWSHSATVGRNSFGKQEFLAPAPIPGHGTHRYVFQLFALDRRLGLPAIGFRAVMAAMSGHALACGVLTGLYERA